MKGGEYPKSKIRQASDEFVNCPVNAQADQAYLSSVCMPINST